MLLVQRAEERVVVEPRAFALQERPELAGARRTRAVVITEEPAEGGTQRSGLQRPHRPVIDGSLPAHALELAPQVILQPGFAARIREFRNVGDADEDGIDRHRAHRRVRRVLALFHLVDGQDLHEIEACIPEPRRQTGKVGDLPDAPAARRRDGEQGHEHTRVPAGMKRVRIRH
jgi:hypothetical protein